MTPSLLLGQNSQILLFFFERVPNIFLKIINQMIGCFIHRHMYMYFICVNDLWYEILDIFCVAC